MLEDFGDTVETLGGDYLTAEDVGTGEPDMEVIAGRTEHVTGLRLGLRRPEPVDGAGLRGRGARRPPSGPSAPRTSTAAASP